MRRADMAGVMPRLPALGALMHLTRSHPVALPLNGGRHRLGAETRSVGLRSLRCRAMSSPAAQRKAAERARHKEAGRVAVTHYIYPEARELLKRYVQRLNERTERARAG